MKKIIFFMVLFTMSISSGFLAYSSNFADGTKPLAAIIKNMHSEKKIVIIKTKKPITKEDLEKAGYPTTMCFADEPVWVSTNCNTPDGSCIYTYSVTIHCFTFNLAN